MLQENHPIAYYVQFLEARDFRGFWVREVFQHDSLNLARLRGDKIVFFATEEEAQKACDFSNKLYQFNN